MTDIASQCNHYAKYVLEATEGTLGKVSNNPAEQNHSSIVHWVGAKLYEEPGYEIKQLLGRQKELEKKRSQEKGEYFFQIKFEISVRPQFTADIELKRAKTLLDKKSFAMWHEEKTLSINYILAVDESNVADSSPIATHLYLNA